VAAVVVNVRALLQVMLRVVRTVTMIGADRRPGSGCTQIVAVFGTALQWFMVGWEGGFWRKEEGRKNRLEIGEKMREKDEFIYR